MNDNDLPEYELPEWLQREADEAREAQAAERLWIGLGVMAVAVAAVFGLNAALKWLGYGAHG